MNINIMMIRGRGGGEEKFNISVEFFLNLRISIFSNKYIYAVQEENLHGISLENFTETSTWLFPYHERKYFILVQIDFSFLFSLS